MAFSKKTREEVYKKTGGKCAYCGCDLPKRWQVDHVVPVVRNISTGEYLGEGTDNINNLLPSCPSCNIIKSSQSLESFREELENMYNSVARNGTFKIAERYSIVERKQLRIQFYFEKIGIIVVDYYKQLLKEEEKCLESNLFMIAKAKADPDTIWNEDLWNEKVKQNRQFIEVCKNIIECNK